MAFYGLKFIYDNIPSDSMGLYIGELDGSNVKNSSSSVERELEYEYNPTRDEFMVFGTRPTDGLYEFELNLFSYDKIDRQQMNMIERWLFNKHEPKKLVICQDDMYQYSYNCIMSGEWGYIGNVGQVLKCKVKCDSRYGYGSKSVIALQNRVVRNIYNNTINPIIYPKIEFVCNRANGQVSVENATENRIFTMTGLQANEKITIDKWFQITSSTGLLRLENCNKNWFRLVEGVNIVQVIGDVSSVKLEYTPQFAING